MRGAQLDLYFLILARGDRMRLADAHATPMWQAEGLILYNMDLNQS